MIDTKKPKQNKQKNTKPKLNRRMNAGLQKYLLKNHFIKAGFKGDLDKLDFEAHFDSTLDYFENLEIFEQLAIDEHLVDDNGRQASDVFTTREIDDQIEAHEKQEKLEFLLEKLRNKFNEEEGFDFSKLDFEDILYTHLITSNTANLGAPKANEQPFIPSQDYSNIKELIDILKSNKKHEKSSEGNDTNERSLNINS